MNFTDLAKDYGFTRLEDLPELEQMEVVGAWLKDNRGHPNEVEAIVEALCDGVKVNEECEHVMDAFQIMHDGVLGEGELADWGYKLLQKLLYVYRAHAQEDLEKAQPVEDEDGYYRGMRKMR